MIKLFEYERFTPYHEIDKKPGKIKVFTAEDFPASEVEITVLA
ncbi:hypothetical protein [Chryseobacterium taklimakanense]|nr:hypothetical protein [Chryseobacterium taklimakanense]